MCVKCLTKSLYCCILYVTNVLISIGHNCLFWSHDLVLIDRGQHKGHTMHTDGYDDNGDYYSAEYDDEEMPATERELADDAQWKVIQKNTFTRWTNEHLKQANKSIADLEIDLSDGLRLCALIEVLSGKKFKRLNKRPNFRSQKLENVTTALKFLEEDEGIKIVNIGKSQSVKCCVLIYDCTACL